MSVGESTHTMTNVSCEFLPRFVVSVLSVGCDDQCQSQSLVCFFVIRKSTVVMSASKETQKLPVTVMDKSSRLESVEKRCDRCDGWETDSSLLHLPIRTLAKLEKLRARAAESPHFCRKLVSEHTLTRTISTCFIFRIDIFLISEILLPPGDGRRQQCD